MQFFLPVLPVLPPPDLCFFPLSRALKVRFFLKMCTLCYCLVILAGREIWQESTLYVY